MLLGCQTLGVPGTEQLGFSGFVASTALNLIFAMPALYVTETFRSSSLVLSALVGAAAVALPALILRTPPFSFEDLPERGFSLFPLVVFVSLGALSGIYYAACERRADL